MHSLDETQCQPFKQKGEKTNEKKNHSGIAMCCITAYTVS